jgi:isopenicillin N synthase-like dioxygenase
MENLQALDRTLHLPVIDIRPLILGAEGRSAVAAQLGRACREYGFFYIVGHGVERICSSGWSK